MNAVWTLNTYLINSGWLAAEIEGSDKSEAAAKLFIQDDLSIQVKDLNTDHSRLFQGRFNLKRPLSRIREDPAGEQEWI